MRQYGALAAREILATGVKVEYWDLGNEVENGISGVCVYPFFPIDNYRAPEKVDPAIGTMSTVELIAMPESDRIAWCQKHLWPYVGKLLAAAADGIRSVAGRGARFSTHVSDFGQRSPAVQLAFWQTAKSVGYLPDLFGTSYYPTDGRTDLGATDRVAWLRGIAQGLYATYGRKLFISEYGYPSSLMEPPYVFNDAVAGYPQTETGQYNFLHDLVSWGSSPGCSAGSGRGRPTTATTPAGRRWRCSASTAQRPSPNPGCAQFKTPSPPTPQPRATHHTSTGAGDPGTAESATTAADARRSVAGFTVASTARRPHHPPPRIQWPENPEHPAERVQEVDLLIDGRVAWI
jgi:hypothetical protein